jgi:hypothetical protein
MVEGGVGGEWCVGGGRGIVGGVGRGAVRKRQFPTLSCTSPFVRAVKEFVSKTNMLCMRKFKSCSGRLFFYNPSPRPCPISSPRGPPTRAAHFFFLPQSAEARRRPARTHRAPRASPIAHSPLHTHVHGSDIAWHVKERVSCVWYCGKASYGEAGGVALCTPSSSRTRRCTHSLMALTLPTTGRSMLRASDGAVRHRTATRADV